MIDEGYRFYDEAGDLYPMIYGTGSSGPDLQMYLRLAKETGGPFLEMGCGYGRVSLWLAQQGVRVVGVDLSVRILAIALSKQTEVTLLDKRGLLTYIHADMRSIRLADHFGVVAYPYSSLLELPTPEDIILAIQTGRHHLRDTGLLVIDNFYYGEGGERRANGTERVRPNTPSWLEVMEEDWYEELGGWTERWVTAKIRDTRGRLIDSRTFSVRRLYLPPDRMRASLIEAGFDEGSIQLFGDFDREYSLDASVFRDKGHRLFNKARQVWICQK